MPMEKDNFDINEIIAESKAKKAGREESAADQAVIPSSEPANSNDLKSHTDEADQHFTDTGKAFAEMKGSEPEGIKTPAEQPLPVWKKLMSVLFDILFYVFIFTMIAGSTMFAFSNDESKSIFGYRFYTVLSDSMRPEFAKGDMIIVKLVDETEIEIGDIITFNPGSTSGAYLTHRAVGFTDKRAGVSGKYVITRGDTNDADDPPTPVENIIGKEVFHIPHVGTVIKFIQENFVPMIIALVAMFLLILVLKSLFGRDDPEIPEGKKKRPSTKT